jgi:hypothetical protein
VPANDTRFKTIDVLNHFLCTGINLSFIEKYFIVKITEAMIERTENEIDMMPYP